MLCSWFDAWKITDPGPTRRVWPLTSDSTVPSLMITSSSSACLCGGCGVSPGFNVVTWHSSSSSVAVGAWKNLREDPIFVGVAAIDVQSNTDDRITGSSARANVLRLTIDPMVASAVIACLRVNIVTLLEAHLKVC